MGRFIESFDAYTTNFDMKNNMIKSRYHHSYRVMELSRKIGELLKFSENEIYVARVIGLLHDYGRFEQIKQYNTVNDNESVDHAEYSIRYLFDENQIEEFVNDEELFPIIRKSIYYHNKYALPNRGLTKDERKHAKLIRDTDKIDTLYLIGVLKDYELEITSEPIRDSISSYFYEGKQVPYASIKNDNERVISLLAYIYDLNYKESFMYLTSIHLLEIFFNNLGRPDNLKIYFDKMNEYIEKASAIVTEDGGMTSHAAIVGINLGKPVVVSATDILTSVKDGELITVDSARGAVYRGSSRVL